MIIMVKIYLHLWKQRIILLVSFIDRLGIAFISRRHRFWCFIRYWTNICFGHCDTFSQILGSFCFGMSRPFYKSGVSLKKQIIIGLIFRVITPLGICLGLLSDALQTYVTDVFISITAAHLCMLPL